MWSNEVEERNIKLKELLSKKYLLEKGNPNDFQFLPTAKTLALKAVCRADPNANIEWMFKVKNRLVTPDNIDYLDQYWRRHIPLWKNQLKAFDSIKGVLSYCDVIEKLRTKIRVYISRLDSRNRLLREAVLNEYILERNMVNPSFINRLMFELENEIKVLAETSNKWMIEIIKSEEDLIYLGPTPVITPLEFAEKFRKMREKIRKKSPLIHRPDISGSLASHHFTKVMCTVPSEKAPPKSPRLFPSLGRHWKESKQKLSNRWRNMFGRNVPRPTITKNISTPIITYSDGITTTQIQNPGYFALLQLSQVLDTHKEYPNYLFPFLPKVTDILKTSCNPKTYRTIHKIVSANWEDIQSVSNQWFYSHPEWIPYLKQLYQTNAKIEYCRHLRLFLEQLIHIIGSTEQEFNNSSLMTQLYDETQLLWTPRITVRNLVICDFNQILRQLRVTMLNLNIFPNN